MLIIQHMESMLTHQRLAALRAHAATLDEFPCVGDPAEHIMEHEYDLSGGWCIPPRRWYTGSVLPELGISMEEWLGFCAHQD